VKKVSDSRVFNAYSRYYDLLYRDKDYTGEVEYVAALFARHGLSGCQLLELGSGTGKHGRLLAERGYQVTGVERSADMVARAIQTGGFSCRQGDICSVKLGCTFDAVLSLFHVMSYQVSNSSINAVLARSAEHLKSGGLFVFDVWYSPAVCEQRPEIRVKRMTDGVVEITRIAEPVIYPNENRVDVNYTIFVREIATGAFETFGEIHPMRHFSLPELDFLADAHGFERLAAEAFMTGESPGKSTWGVCIVLRKM
jgi:SAM-dependent methyltransferase